MQYIFYHLLPKGGAKSCGRWLDLMHLIVKTRLAKELLVNTSTGYIYSSNKLLHPRTPGFHIICFRSSPDARSKNQGFKCLKLWFLPGVGPGRRPEFSVSGNRYGGYDSRRWSPCLSRVSMTSSTPRRPKFGMSIRSFSDLPTKSPMVSIPTRIRQL